VRVAALAATGFQRSSEKAMGTSTHAATACSPCRAGTNRQRFTVSIAALAVSRHAVDASTATVLTDFAEHTTQRLDSAAARLEGAGSDGTAMDGGVRDRWTGEEVNAALDPIIRARLARLERQLDTLMTAVDDVVTLGASALDTRR